MEAVPAEQLVSFARACDGHERVTFAYRTFDGTETERRAEPHRLVATDRRWYVVAFDLDRDDWRTFRVDRASSVVLTGHTFVPRRLDDPGRMVSEGIATATYSYRAVIRVQAPFEEVSAASGRPSASHGRDGGETIAEIGADDFDWLAGYVTSFGWDFELLEPAEWREMMAALGERLRRAHAARQRRSSVRLIPHGTSRGKSRADHRGGTRTGTLACAPSRRGGRRDRGARHLRADPDTAVPDGHVRRSRRDRSPVEAAGG